MFSIEFFLHQRNNLKTPGYFINYLRGFTGCINKLQNKFLSYKTSPCLRYKLDLLTK